MQSWFKWCKIRRREYDFPSYLHYGECIVRERGKACRNFYSHKFVFARCLTANLLCAKGSAEMWKMMQNYKIVIQYDGTRYRGWQGQNSTEATIQGKIESVLSAMAGEAIEITGSGRTDAGVHAIGQVANFHLRGTWECGQIREYLNQYLPEDIAVSSVEKVDERFHSRYHAVSKTYLYRIHTGDVPEVFDRKYVYDYRTPLDLERMQKAAALLVGTHDFKSFCGNRKMKKSTVRTIREIRIEKQCKVQFGNSAYAQSGEELQIFYTGDGFLQNMVRILTGTLIEIGDGRRAPEDVTEILAAKERAAAGYTAPACGLTLLNVTYAG